MSKLYKINLYNFNENSLFRNEVWKKWIWQRLYLFIFENIFSSIFIKQFLYYCTTISFSWKILKTWLVCKLLCNVPFWYFYLYGLFFMVDFRSQDKRTPEMTSGQTWWPNALTMRTPAKDISVSSIACGPYGTACSPQCWMSIPFCWPPEDYQVRPLLKILKHFFFFLIFFVGGSVRKYLVIIIKIIEWK